MIKSASPHKVIRSCLNLGFAPARYIAKHPWSVVALSCIAGDSCYLGFVVNADHTISFIKALGAVSAFAGQLILLAYGDDQIKYARQEEGTAARLLLATRRKAKKIIEAVTRGRGIAKPIATGFGLLIVNGIALTSEAFSRSDLSAHSQIGLGWLIILGCGAYAAADLVSSQRLANILTRIAPAILYTALIPSLVLGITTKNLFILASVGFFTLSNFAGFHTKIDKSLVSHSPPI